MRVEHRTPVRPSVPAGRTPGPVPAAGAPGLSVQVHPEASVVTVTLAGELDLATVGQFIEVTQEAARSGCPRVEVELGGLAFCDLIGLTALQAAGRRLTAAGARLTLRNPPPSLRRLLEVLDAAAGLDPAAGLDLP